MSLEYDKTIQELEYVTDGHDWRHFQMDRDIYRNKDKNGPDRVHQ
jgi:hypothetical protein